MTVRTLPWKGVRFVSERMWFMQNSPGTLLAADAAVIQRDDNAADSSLGRAEAAAPKEQRVAAGDGAVLKLM